MSAAHDGGTAFPMQDPQAIHAYAMGKVAGMSGDTDERDKAYLQARAEAVGGMSLRNYLAAKAMQAMTEGSWPDGADRDEIARRSYLMADAMLKASQS